MKKILMRSAAVVSVLAVLWCAVRAMPIGVLDEFSSETEASGKMIALTFDDGPSEYTSQLLDILEENGAKATFFVLGNKVDKYPDEVKRMKESGQMIGMHGNTHVDMLFSSLSEIENEISLCSEKISRITGETPLFFRPPHGYVLDHQLKTLPVYFVGWSYDPYDWKHTDADYVYEHIVNNAKEGAIILLHDTKKTTVEAMERAVPYLISQGFELVRVDELLTADGRTVKPGVFYKR